MAQLPTAGVPVPLKSATVLRHHAVIMNVMGTLRATNKYLSSARKRANAVRVTVATSSAIEGIHAPFQARSAKARTAKAGKAIGGGAVKPSQHAKSAR